MYWGGGIDYNMCRISWISINRTSAYNQLLIELTHHQ